MKTTMTAPVLKCVKREEREKDGFSSFKEWVEAPNHIYIGHNIRKYLNDFIKKDSIWCNPFITFDLGREEKIEYYEAFLRCNPHLLEQLNELENKVLGCWCENIELCHGQVLVNLYIEKFGEEKYDVKEMGDMEDSGEKERKRMKIDDLMKKDKKHYAWINMKI